MQRVPLEHAEDNLHPMLIGYHGDGKIRPAYAPLALQEKPSLPHAPLHETIQSTTSNRHNSRNHPIFRANDILSSPKLMSFSYLISSTTVGKILLDN